MLLYLTDDPLADFHRWDADNEYEDGEETFEESEEDDDYED